MTIPSPARPLLPLLLLLGGCGGGDPDAGPREAEGPLPATAGAEASPQDAFFAHLEALCGRAFRGEATLTSPGSTGFDGEMIMHVRRCEPEEIQIPLHIGENRSRTWIVTRTDAGLRLKHDHRVEDGSDDPVTQYGGDTRDPGTNTRQAFPADAFTAELLPEAATNIWTMTIDPGAGFVYHLTRHGEPRATFTFDLTDEVEPPPAPWGYEGS